MLFRVALVQAAVELLVDAARQPEPSLRIQVPAHSSGVEEIAPPPSASSVSEYSSLQSPQSFPVSP